MARMPAAPRFAVSDGIGPLNVSAAEAGASEDTTFLERGQPAALGQVGGRLGRRHLAGITGVCREQRRRIAHDVLRGAAANTPTACSGATVTEKLAAAPRIRIRSRSCPGRTRRPASAPLRRPPPAAGPDQSLVTR